jgi:glycosyltransferase involved in cell wall biosynthesis
MTTSVSVVMSVFNGRRYVKEQIQSVLSQLEANDELIITDDASVDDSMDIIRAIHSPLIRLFRNKSNLGVIRNFQNGLTIARKEVVFLCDQDDIWLPGKRAAFVAAFDANPATAVVVSDAEVIDASGALIARSFMAGRGGFSGSIRGTLWRNRFLGCAMAVRHSVVKSALPIPEWAPMHDMWLGVIGCMAGRVHYLSTPYLQYRRHGQNATTRAPNPVHVMFRLRAALLTTLIKRRLELKYGFHDELLTEAASAHFEVLSPLLTV